MPCVGGWWGGEVVGVGVSAGGGGWDAWSRASRSLRPPVKSRPGSPPCAQGTTARVCRCRRAPDRGSRRAARGGGRARLAGPDQSQPVAPPAGRAVLFSTHHTLLLSQWPVLAPPEAREGQIGRKAGTRRHHPGADRPPRRRLESSGRAAPAHCAPAAGAGTTLPHAETRVGRLHVCERGQREGSSSPGRHTGGRGGREAPIGGPRSGQRPSPPPGPPPPPPSPQHRRPASTRAPQGCTWTMVATGQRSTQRGGESA